MRRTTLLALAAALAVGGWIAFFEREDTGTDAGEPVFGLDEGDILAVEIERPGEAVVRVSRSGDDFTVAEGDGPEVAADASAADVLFQNVVSLRFEREIEGVPAADLGGFGLAPPGLQVRVTAAEAPEDPRLHAGFGDETPASGNRYLLLGERVLVTSAFARDNFGRSAWDLRDKRLFRLEAPAARRLRLTTPDGTAVEVAREQGVWWIERPWRFAADPYEASQLAARLLDGELAGQPPAADAGQEDPFGLQAPRLIAELDLVFGPQEEASSRTVRFGAESRTPPGVFAQLAPDEPVFVVGTPLYEALREAADSRLAGLRSLRLFRFAGFRVVELRVENPEGTFHFLRQDDGEGRAWTLEAGDGEPAAVGTVAVEDLLYKLNSTDAEGVGDPALPDTGAGWLFAVTEDTEDGEEPTAPETVRLTVSPAGEAQALRSGDERTLTLGADAWEEIAALFAAARTPLPDPK